MINKILQSRRGNVHYWIKGNSPKCIIFTHGMTMDYKMFLNQVKYFSNDFTTIVWDVPLHGESKPYANFNFGNVVEEMNQIIETEGFTSVHLVGQSMGGYIIQAYALSYPEKVLSLTAVDTNPFGSEYYTKFEKNMALKMGKLTWLYPYKTLINAIAKKSCYTKDAQKLAFETLKNMTKKEIIYLMDIVYKEMFSREERNHFSVPVQVVYGEFDNAGFVKKYSKMWAEKENYELVKIKNAGHNSNVDNPDDFNKILDNFIRKVEIS